jgi:hypothetical protein
MTQLIRQALRRLAARPVTALLGSRASRTERSELRRRIAVAEAQARDYEAMAPERIS